MLFVCSFFPLSSALDSTTLVGIYSGPAQTSIPPHRDTPHSFFVVLQSFLDLTRPDLIPALSHSWCLIIQAPFWAGRLSDVVVVVVVFIFRPVEPKARLPKGIGRPAACMAYLS